MKFLDNEVDRLIDTMINTEKMKTVNYKDFLKFSYLFQLYKNHMQLELDLKSLDEDGKGLITVASVDKLLQDEKNVYKFPPDALDKVFNEMLGSNLGEVDRNCIIKIDAFMDSLKQQFEIDTST